MYNHYPQMMMFYNQMYFQPQSYLIINPWTQQNASFFNQNPNPQEYLPVPSISVQNTKIQETTQQDQIQNEQSQKPQIQLTKQDLLKYVNTVNRKLWTEQQDQLLKKAAIEKQLDWKYIASYFPERNANQCYGRYRRLVRQSRRRSWTRKQDQMLIQCVQKFGQSWKSFIGHFQKRTSKQIRERYLNNLRPHIVNEEWSVQQDLKICRLVRQYGKKWKLFQTFLNGRTQNRIKNRYYGHIRKIQFMKIKQVRRKIQSTQI